jgi:hypothetical protein
VLISNMRTNRPTNARQRRLKNHSPKNQGGDKLRTATVEKGNNAAGEVEESCGGEWLRGVAAFCYCFAVAVGPLPSI